ncbi:MAG: Lar family restriction alleviation protein [Treponema sp.]|jgi:Lar family restriction alleviation protein|nr:Lar family restriction alleviation protein [Treponema sp.]
MIAKCPFCGNTSTDEFAIHHEVRSLGFDPFHIVYNAACSCGARGPDAETELKAVERWNERTGEGGYPPFCGEKEGGWQCR